MDVVPSCVGMPCIEVGVAESRSCELVSTAKAVAPAASVFCVPEAEIGALLVIGAFPAMLEPLAVPVRSFCPASVGVDVLEGIRLVAPSTTKPIVSGCDRIEELDFEIPGKPGAAFWPLVTRGLAEVAVMELEPEENAFAGVGIGGVLLLVGTLVPPGSKTFGVSGTAIVLLG